MHRLLISGEVEHGMARQNVSGSGPPRPGGVRWHGDGWASLATVPTLPLVKNEKGTPMKYDYNDIFEGYSQTNITRTTARERFSDLRGLQGEKIHPDAILDGWFDGTAISGDGKKFVVRTVFYSPSHPICVDGENRLIFIIEAVPQGLPNP